MKRIVSIAAVSFAAGILLTAVVGFFSAPSLMMLEDESPYDFDRTVEMFQQRVSDGGWSVLETHDMQAILAGHGHEVEAVKIFELCSSQYSAQILRLDDERIVAPLMPCRVAIYRKSNGNTYIARMNSQLMARPFGGVIASVMDAAAVETEEIIAGLLDGELAAASR